MSGANVTATDVALVLLGLLVMALFYALVDSMRIAFRREAEVAREIDREARG